MGEENLSLTALSLLLDPNKQTTNANISLMLPANLLKREAKADTQCSARATYQVQRVGEIHCQLYITYRINNQNAQSTEKTNNPVNKSGG